MRAAFAIITLRTRVITYSRDWPLWLAVNRKRPRGTLAYPTPLVCTAPKEQVSIGGSRVLRSSDADQITIVACGVPVEEAHGQLRP